jgi:CRISPR-associated exonuclease Cas4
LKPFRDRLVPEVPIYGLAPKGIHELIAGRVDAVAWAEDGSKVAFDWKSHVAPAGRTAYYRQLGQYLHVVGAKLGGVVYMTTGHIDWVTTRP